MRRIKKYLLLFITVIMLASCSAIKYPDETKSTLKEARKNKNQLKIAIRYFHSKGDSLQLDALYYLLNNMSDHSFVEIALYDSNKVEIPWNVLDHKNYDEAESAMNELEVQHGELNWAVKERKKDINTISADFLIDNIELAFEAWREKPWAQNYSYDIFKEYILPYRGSNEPIESWRSWRGYFLEDFKDLEKQMENPDDPVEAAQLINTNLKDWFKFDPLFYLNPTDQGLFEMLKNKIGRCEDMTNITIYAMRANGIPVTSDYTPHWADTGNNHAWNSIVLPDGKILPFMGSEANPGDYSLSHRLAKAYRKMFSEQKNNLVFKLQEGEKAPAWLAGKSYMDVTTDYTNVHDVTFMLDYEIPDSTNFAYLCVFNSGKWKAIHWSEIQNEKVTFTDMGVNIVYLPMFYVHKELEPAGKPFIFMKNGDLRFLEGDGNYEETELVSVTKKLFDKATEFKKVVFLDEGEVYELFYWDDEWKSLGKQTATSDPLTYRNVPKKHLLWLVKEDSKEEERIFTYDNNKQRWW